MIDETGTPSVDPGTTNPGEGSSDAVVAFCQQCGRPLTATTRRQVGAGTFCEPCAAVQQAQAPGWNPVNAGSSPYAPGSAPVAAAEPNPALAGFLGLIPGVGAMYNGQYAKGVIHLIVFVVLVSLADNLNWVFWWFVWGWIFYQAFEAYHTAQARRDGLPVPDPFGWNELGERLGFSRPAPTAARAPRPTSAAPFTPPPPVVPPAAPPGATPQPGIPFQDAPHAPGTSAPPPVAGASYTNVPYSATYTGFPAAATAPVVTPGPQRFPAGAIWLIALGVLFLIGNIVPEWRVTGRWLVPILLAGIALWIGGRRLVALQEPSLATLPGMGRASLASSLLGPAVLLTLAVLLAFQNAYWVPLRHSWPILLIVWGALLLVQRAQAAATPPIPPGRDSPAPFGSNTPPIA